MEELSPFLFGRTVTDTEFVNRQKDMEHLWLNLKSGINTALISPRRWGKSSLVKQVSQIKSSQKNIKWCFIDMFSIRSEEEFCEKLSQEVIKATSTKWEEWAKSAKMFFKHLIPKLSIGIDPLTDFSISFEHQELKKHQEEVLNLPEIIAKKYGVKFIICIDEFQNIREFKECDAFEKSLRSVWQHHTHVSYCLYGSKRNLMSEIFNKKNKAFYQFGDLMLLEKIAVEHWIPFIVNSFKKTNKSIDKVLAQQIAQTMKGHPYYVQQYAHYVWENTSNEVLPETLDFCLDRLLETNQILYQREIEDLATTQINLLKAVIREEKHFTSSSVMYNYQLGTTNNVSKNLKVLQNLDIIERTKEKTTFLDPAFELWFKMYYLKK